MVGLERVFSGLCVEKHAAFRYNNKQALVAQWIEQEPSKFKVGSSSLSGGAVSEGPRKRAFTGLWQFKQPMKGIRGLLWL